MAMHERLSALFSALNPIEIIRENYDARSALRERNARMTDVMATRWTTSADILRADLGTDNPKGLNLQPILDNETVAVRYQNDKSYMDRYGLWRTIQAHFLFGGSANYYDDVPTINMAHYYRPTQNKNGVVLDGGDKNANTFAHEHTHIRQGLQLFSGITSTASSSLVLRPLEFIYHEEQRLGKIKILFNRLSNNIDAMTPSGLASLLGPHIPLTIQRYGKNYINSYLGRDEEMQARLHEILASGHAVWRRMPSTKVELWAALSQCGLNTPKNIKDTLKNTEEGQQALQNFSSNSVLRDTIASTVRAFNLVYGYAGNEKGRAHLWNHAYPYLYGNLLELYGDDLGRERMDMGPSRAPLIELAHIITNAPIKDGGYDYYKNKISNIINAMPDGLLQETFAYLCFRSHDDDRKAYIDHALDETLAHPGAQNTIVRPHTIVEHGTHELPPLYRAAFQGHEGIAEKLFKAGARLDDDINFVSIDNKEHKVQVATYIEAAAQDSRSILADPNIHPNVLHYFKKHEDALRTLARLGAQYGQIDTPLPHAPQRTLRDSLGPYLQDHPIPGATPRTTASTSGPTGGHK